MQRAPPKGRAATGSAKEAPNAWEALRMKQPVRPSDGQGLLTVERVAEYLGVSRNTVRKLVAERAIESHRVGSQIRVHPDALQDYLTATRHARQA